MKYFWTQAGLIFLLFTSLLFTSGCGNRETQFGLYGHCNPQSSVGVSIVNIPADISLSSVRVIAVDEQGRVITLEPRSSANVADSENNRSGFFSKSGSHHSSYEAQIYFGDQQVANFPINYAAYWCSHGAQYDAETEGIDYPIKN